MSRGKEEDGNTHADAVIVADSDKEAGPSFLLRGIDQAWIDVLQTRQFQVFVI